jgi:hypothetical protein
MIRYAALALLLALGPAQSQAPPLVCTQYATTMSESLRIVGVCGGWKAYRTADGMVVVCPGARVPAGAIELREYYYVGDRAR